MPFIFFRGHFYFYIRVILNLSLKKVCGFNKELKQQKSEYKREDTVEDARNKKQGRNLPHWVIYIAYACKFNFLNIRIRTKSCFNLLFIG